MRKPRKVAKELTDAFYRDTLPTLSADIQAAAYGVQISITFARRGWARYHRRTLTVPAWTLDKARQQRVNPDFYGGREFFIYYLCHELAHIAARTHGHGPTFMAAFKLLCPPHLQWLELGYKPRNAAAAGISLPKGKTCAISS